jgi:glutamyl-tRNA synthetase
MIPDEGPLNYGGDLGPYIQSQRLSIYEKYVNKLLDSGHAYHCFCSERRLDLLKKEAIKARQVPKYDNRCRDLTPKQIAEKMAKGDQHCIRFKLSDCGESYNDLIYGNYVYYVAQNEGDPVILKSDRYPTYHFANVVDDYLMKITHVLRGVEWQISTPKHLMIYRALGWTPPKFGHLPLIMNSDGSKLSKRQNDIKLDFYREKGIFSKALINYITQAGGGFDRQPEERTLCLNMNDLIQKFDLKKINSNSSRLNPDLLDDLNRLELKSRVENPEEIKKLIKIVRELIKQKYPLNADQLDLDDDHISNVLRWSVKRINSINELAEEKLSFLWVLPQIAKGKEILLNEGEQKC